jgi:hypothetical protein
MLLTDGSVVAFEAFYGDPTNPARRVLQLYPDEVGNYVTASWFPLQNMHNSRRWFASAVLSDGRLFVAGGEYSDACTPSNVTGADTNTCELYDPVTDEWINLIPPQHLAAFGDASCCVLENGRVLVGSSSSNVGAAVIFDPKAGMAGNCFMDAASKGSSNNEETWTLLPDGSVLTVECYNLPHAKRYVPQKPGEPDKWVDAGSLAGITDDNGQPVGLVQASSNEIGPAILLPSGQVFAIGATGYTALYDPKSGEWSKGPVFPKAPDAGAGNKLKPLQPKDAPACLLPNGRVLCSAGPPRDGSSDQDFPGPSRFFEYDGAKLVEVSPPKSPMTTDDSTSIGWMLLLPTGQVLYSEQSRDLYIYTPDKGNGEPRDEWRPVITDCPRTLTPGKDHLLKGLQLNGLSQACSYGDDASMATNYPVIRLEEDTGHSDPKVYYCRTHDHSTMGVATGEIAQLTNFFVYANVPTGKYQLFVIANGIPSKGWALEIAAPQVALRRINN